MIKNPLSTAWGWVPSLYFTEALPMIFVASVVGILMKAMGISNDVLTLWTGSITLTWAIKGLWSPFMESCFSRKQWIILTQGAIGLLFFGMGFILAEENAWFIPLIVMLWAMAFTSATHDIAADGYYMDALDDHQQTFFSGIRNTFYRLGNIAANGGLIALVGILKKYGDFSTVAAWQCALFVAGFVMCFLAIYHFLMLQPPRPAVAQSPHQKIPFREAFTAFFKLPGIVSGLAFILFFRFAEAQLEQVSKLFLLDDIAKGGLALSEIEYGVIKGGIGVGALLAGGVLGGLFAAKDGLKRWFWTMVFAMNVPNVLYVYLAYAQPENIILTTTCLAIEQFGYGFGFTAFMLYMLALVEKSQYRTSHYALLTGFMALGYALPGTFSGSIQIRTGYPLFFIWVLISTIPSFITAYYIKFPNDFGLKKRT